MNQEVEFYKKLMVENRSRLTRQLIICVGVSIISYVVIGLAWNRSYTAQENKIQSITSDNATLIELVENQTTQIERLRKLGWSDAKIDRFVTEGCLMYIEVEGVQ